MKTTEKDWHTFFNWVVEAKTEAEREKARREFDAYLIEKRREEEVNDSKDRKI